MSRTRSQHTTLPIPDGWFAVAWSKDIAPGEVKRIQYFDEDLVLFRTRSGEPKVLDGFCPHLGAHLGEGGRVVGENIRCPFHAWQFDGAGNCVDIPYCKRIPPNAKTRSWEVVERNLMIFVWHHAENKPPYWEVPTIPELSASDWTAPRYYTIDVGVHMQEMAENNCDPVHFQYVHSAAVPPDSEMTYGEEGRFFRITSKNEHETPHGTFEMELERDTWGLGISTVRLKGIPNAGVMIFTSTAPVSTDRSHSRWLFTSTHNFADLGGEDFIQGCSSGVLQDTRIWENKIHRANPVFCEGDEYLAEFRRWTRQFYSSLDHSK